MTILESELSRLGLVLPIEAREKLEWYLRELERWNRTVNLTSLQGAELARRLVAEPCWIGQELQMSGRLVDVGSGNGCPGIPLYVACNLNRVDLVEGRARRAAFLRHIAGELGLDGIVVHRLRLEDTSGPIGGVVDWISLQGVRPATALVQVLRRLFLATTRVVWITADRLSAPATASRLSVPGSNTVAWVCRLDQF